MNSVKVAGFDEMIDDMERGVFDFTDGDKCSNCGACCSDFLPLSKREISKIKEYISSHGIKEQKHLFPFATPADVDLTCPFRNNEKRKCEIYEVRPAICHDFQCNNAPKGKWEHPTMTERFYSIISMRQTFFRK